MPTHSMSEQRFVEHETLMVVDEIQLVPELLQPIKVAVDLDPTPGRYLLTGSSRVLALRRSWTSHSPARVERHRTGRRW